MADDTETAVLAGGCFWIMQQLLREREGIVSTRVGWTGGDNASPTEEDNAGHAEAVEVVFDPKRISYRDLLELFLQFHRADLDKDLVGSSYRSEIFCTTDEQRSVAEETLPDVDAWGHWPGRVVTQISKAGPFWEGEAEDQDYFQRYPQDRPSPFPRRSISSGSGQSTNG
jgi:peptide-methionine (S)-S-oxide reductase